MRRSGHGTPISLFSFQDVMISTIGITLLIILVLLLLAGRKAVSMIAVPDAHEQDVHDTSAAPAPESIEDPAKMQLELLSLEDQIDEVQRLLDEMQRAAQRSHTETLLDTERSVQDAMERRAATLAGELDELRTRKRVTYLLDREDSDRIPLVIELGGGRAVLGGGGDDEASFALHNGDPSALARTVADWVDDLPDRDRRVLVFVIRPSGVGTWRHIRALLPQWSADGIGHGIDLIAEDWSTSGLMAMPEQGAAP